MLIGLAVGVDYSLFYIRREREERAKGHGKLDAIDIASATSGRAVLISGLTVIAAMAGMFLTGNTIFMSMGLATIIVVAVAVIGSLTVLPAVLAGSVTRSRRAACRSPAAARRRPASPACGAGSTDRSCATRWSPSSSPAARSSRSAPTLAARRRRASTACRQVPAEVQTGQEDPEGASPAEAITRPSSSRPPT